MMQEGQSEVEVEVPGVAGPDGHASQPSAEREQHVWWSMSERYV